MESQTLVVWGNPLGPQETAQRPRSETFSFLNPACQPFQTKEPKAIIASNGQGNAGETAPRVARSMLPNNVEGVRLKTMTSDAPQSTDIRRGRRIEKILGKSGIYKNMLVLEGWRWEQIWLWKILDKWATNTSIPVCL